MEWTSETPSEAGYYVYAEGRYSVPTIVRVVITPGDVAHINLLNGSLLLHDITPFQGFWIGPFSAPTKTAKSAHDELVMAINEHEELMAAITEYDPRLS